MDSTYIQLQAVKQGEPLELQKVDKPLEVEKDQMVVKLKAVAINPLDYKRIHYGLDVTSWPVVAGTDGSGIVEKVGSSITRFKEGDRVLGIFGATGPASGAFQEYTVVKPAVFAKQPDAWSYVDAATLPLGFVTAVAALYVSLDIPLPFLKDGLVDGHKPKSLLVLGGSSSVGAAIIQLARLVLPDAIILATASPQHRQHLLSLGASQVFDRNAADVVSQIREATRSMAGIEAAIDAVGAATSQHEYMDLVSIGKKRFAQILTGQDLTEAEAPRGIDFRIASSHDLMKKAGGLYVMEALEGLLARGQWQLPIKATLTGKGWNAIEEAVKRQMQGVSGTKLVVEV